MKVKILGITPAMTRYALFLRGCAFVLLRLFGDHGRRRSRPNARTMNPVMCFPSRLLLPVIATISVVCATQTQQSGSVVGAWATEGYGLVFDVRADSVSSFEITKVSCIPALQAATTAAPPGALAAFKSLSGSTTFAILPGDTPMQARIDVPSTASDMLIRRIEQKPAVCDNPTPDTPFSNFDVFAETWAEQYPFFTEKKTDWARIVAANRAGVSETTTPRRLFQILSAMIAPFEDAHVDQRTFDPEAIRRSPVLPEFSSLRPRTRSRLGSRFSTPHGNTS